MMYAAAFETCVVVVLRNKETLNAWAALLVLWPIAPSCDDSVVPHLSGACKQCERIIVLLKLKIVVREECPLANTSALKKMARLPALRRMDQIERRQQSDNPDTYFNYIVALTVVLHSEPDLD